MIKKIYVLLVVSIGLSLLNCKSDESDSNDDNQESDYLYFISGKINGNPFVLGQLESDTDLIYDMNPSGGGISTSCAYDPETGGVNYNCGLFPYSNQESPSMNINFIKFILCPELENNSQSNLFNDAFPVEEYDFATDASSYGYGTDRSIFISYSQIFNEYPFYNSIGNQDGSYFRITSSSPENTSFNAMQRVEGEFNVKLYNVNDDSDVIEITEGEFLIFPIVQ